MTSLPRGASGDLYMLLVLSFVVVHAAVNPRSITTVMHEELVLSPDTTDREDTQLCLLQIDSSMRHPHPTLAQVSQVGPHGKHTISKSMAVKENATNIVVVKEGERKYDISALPANSTVDTAALQTNMTTGNHGNAVLQPNMTSNTIEIPAMTANMTWRTGDMPPLQLSEFNAISVAMDTKNMSSVSLFTQAQTSSINLGNIIWTIVVLILLAVIIYFLYRHFHHESTPGDGLRRGWERVGDKVHEWEDDVIHGAEHLRRDVTRGTKSGCSRLHDDGPGKPCC